MFVLVFFDNFNMLMYKIKKLGQNIIVMYFQVIFLKNIIAISNTNLDGYS
jgi:hypothetical protein